MFKLFPVSPKQQAPKVSYLMHRFARPKSFISIFLTIVFSATTITGNDLAWAQSASATTLIEVKNMLTPGTIPSEMGILRDYAMNHVNSQNPFVVHIQDAHSNIDAQKNISALLSWIHEKHNVVIGLEGAVDEIRPDYLEFFPEYPEANQAVVDDLLHKGELSGTELFAWNEYKNKKKGNAYQIVAAEDLNLYAENLKSFRELSFEQDEIALTLKKHTKNLDTAKSRIFNAKLNEFLKERDRRKNGNYSSEANSPQLQVYLAYLSATVQTALGVDLNHSFEQIRFPNIVRVLILGEIENALSLRQAMAEKAEVIQKMKKLVKGKEATDAVSELEKLERGMAARQVVEKVWSLSALENFDLNQYAQYKTYLGSLVLSAEVDAEGLFDEMAVLEHWLLDHWSPSVEEKKLVSVVESFDLMEKLLKLRWTTEDLKKFTLNESAVRSAFLGNEISLLAEKFGFKEHTAKNELTAKEAGLLSSWVNQAVTFYQVALERDEALLEKTLAAATKDSVAVIVSGGYHTDGLVSRMHDKEINYAVIQPVIRKNDGGELYHKALTDQNANVSNYFSNNLLNKQEAIYFKQLMEVATPKLWDAYQVPHHELGDKVSYVMNTHEVLSQKLQATATAQKTSSQVDYSVKTSQNEVLGVGNRAVALTPVTTNRRSFGSAYRPMPRQLMVFDDDDDKEENVVVGATTTFRSAGVAATTVRLPKKQTTRSSGVDANQFSSRAELRTENWVSQNTPELANYTVVSRQFEAGLNRDILDALEKKFGRAVANFVSQSNFTGGLGALMPDLIDSWKKNGTDIIAIHPLYNDKIKGIVRDLPEEILSGQKKLGDYLREVLTDMGGDTGIEFQMKLPVGDDFRNKAQGKARNVVDRDLTVHVYKTETRFGKTPSYYLDIFYTDEEGQLVRVFDEVYPDADEGSMLWRDVHMGTYSMATERLVQILQQQGDAKENLLFVDNEVFASMPTPLLPKALHHHINHTVFRPGLYRPDDSSFEMLGYPEWMRPYVIRDGKINVTDAVALNADVITGVGLYEHTPVLGQDGIFSGHLHKLTGYNQDGIRSTNGVLLDQWQTDEKRILIQQYKNKLNLGLDVTDREFFRELETNATLRAEFQLRSEYINAAYVGLFYSWLVAEQNNPVWLDAAFAEINKRTGMTIVDPVKHINNFLDSVRKALNNEADWEAVKPFDITRDVFIEDPIVSNIRRQVPYKGPEKWIEVLESLRGNAVAIEDFRKSSARVVIGGRLFDQGAYNTFQKIKDLVRELGLQDRIVTVENYSIQTAPIIFQAMSGVVMLSDEFLEASATSMMKGLTNFAKLIGVWGGADPELFTIIEVASGREVDVFEEKVTHDQLVENLDKGVWKISNGYLVRYSDEMSNQIGGGRRPSAESLAQALRDLREDYKSTVSRREAQYDALASSYKVDIEQSQARAHAFLWESAIKARQRETAEFKGLALPLKTIQKTLSIQNDNGFTWQRQPSLESKETVVVERSTPGLNGFLQGFRKLRMQGREALWSLSYHVSNQTVSLDGDIFHYVLSVLLPADEPSLSVVRKEIERLAKLAVGSDDVSEKVEFNLQAYEVLDQFALQTSRNLLDHYISGEKEAALLLQDSLVRENLVRYLDINAQPLASTSAGVKNYALDYKKEKVIVAVNVGAFVLSREQDAKAWDTIFGVSSFKKVLGDDVASNLGAVYEAQDVVTGESFRRYSVTDLINKGLSIGVSSSSNVQVLRLAQPQEQKLIDYLSAAVKEEFIGGDRIPAVLLTDTIKKLREKPEQLRQVLENIAKTVTPEEARRKFSNAQGQPVGVPAVMAFIAALSPDLLRYMRDWDTAVYNQLDAVISVADNRDLFDKGDIQFHTTDQRQAIVFSRVLGNRHVVVPIYFGTRPYSQNDGKVWFRVKQNLNTLGVENGPKTYQVYDQLSRQTYAGSMQGAELYRSGWGVGVPVINGPHFQMLTIVPSENQSRNELRTVEFRDYASVEAFSEYMQRDRMPELVASYPEIVELYRKYITAFESGDEATAKSLEKEINVVIDKFNAVKSAGIYQDHVGDFNLDTLTQAKLNEIKTQYSPEDQRRVDELIVAGGYAPEFFAAGAASRLGLGNMFTLSLPEFEEVLRGDKKLDGLDTEKRLAIADRVKAIRESSPEYADTPLGVRLLLNFKADVMDAVRRLNPTATQEDIDKALSNQSFSFLLNEAVADDVIQLFIENDFFGFNRENVFLTVQPPFHGYALDDKGEAIEITEQETIVNGHGYPTMQKFFPGQAFTINDQGQRVVLDRPLTDELISQGVKLLGIYRINDMSNYEYGNDAVVGNALDTNTLIASIEVLGGFDNLDKATVGADQTVELVDNPTKQKGGLFPATPKLTQEGFGVMPDTLAFKDADSVASVSRIEEQIGRGLPYNAMRQVYKLASLASDNPALKGIPAYVRFRTFSDGKLPNLFAAETVTGDTTFFLKTAAVSMPGRVIRDFKTAPGIGDLVERFASQNQRLTDLGIPGIRSELRTDTISVLEIKNGVKPGDIRQLRSLLEAEARLFEGVEVSEPRENEIQVRLPEKDGVTTIVEIGRRDEGDRLQISLSEEVEGSVKHSLDLHLSPKDSVLRAYAGTKPLTHLAQDHTSNYLNVNLKDFKGIRIVKGLDDQPKIEVLFKVSEESELPLDLRNIRGFRANGFALNAFETEFLSRSELRSKLEKSPIFKSMARELRISLALLVGIAISVYTVPMFFDAPSDKTAQVETVDSIATNLFSDLLSDDATVVEKAVASFEVQSKEIQEQVLVRIAVSNTAAYHALLDVRADLPTDYTAEQIKDFERVEAETRKALDTLLLGNEPRISGLASSTIGGRITDNLYYYYLGSLPDDGVVEKIQARLERVNTLSEQVFLVRGLAQVTNSNEIPKALKVIEALLAKEEEMVADLNQLYGEGQKTPLSIVLREAKTTLENRNELRTKESDDLNKGGIALDAFNQIKADLKASVPQDSMVIIDDLDDNTLKIDFDDNTTIQIQREPKGQSLSIELVRATTPSQRINLSLVSPMARGLNSVFSVSSNNRPVHTVSDSRLEYNLDQLRGLSFSNDEGVVQLNVELEVEENRLPITSRNLADFNNAGIDLSHLAFISRNELRLASVLETVVATDDVIEAIRPLVQQIAESNRFRLNSIDSRISEDLAGGIYETAQNLAAKNQLSLDDAMAALITTILNLKDENPEKLDAAINLIDQEMGPEMASIFSSLTAENAVAPTYTATLEELQTEEVQLAVAFILRANPQNRVRFVVVDDDDDEEKALLYKAVSDQVGVTLSGLGTSIKDLPKRLKIEVITSEPRSLEQILRTSAVEAKNIEHTRSAVVSDNLQALRKLPVIADVSYADRSAIKLATAIILTPVMSGDSLDQHVIDMLAYFESKGWNMNTLGQQISNVLKGLRKLATSA